MAVSAYQGTLGVGLLGISDMYREHGPESARSLLSTVLDHYPPFLDTATVYLSGETRLNVLLGEALRGSDSRPSITNKVAAGVTEGGDLGARAIADFEQSCDDLGQNVQDVVLVHKAHQNFVERDQALHDHLRRTQRARLFGICTNSQAVLERYIASMQIDVLQVAVNLIDYAGAEAVMKLAKERGIVVQARSVLASGVLSGKYGTEHAEQFRDTIRRRFGQDEAKKAIFAQRLARMEDIRGFVSSQAHRLGRAEMADFCYAAIRACELVDCVILGGSTHQQIEHNLRAATLELDPAIVAEIYERRIQEWQAPYL